jgi:hypothetical protein
VSLATPVAAFVHPALLGLGAALVSVPILIHLLSRRQVRRVPWAAMQWLLAALKRHQRRLRLENWLVLALRIAAVALLALALARPIVTGSAVAGLLGHAKRSVYLVLDTSYSTLAKATARSVADLVKSEADRVLSGLRADDTVTVVLTNDPRPEKDGLDPHTLVPRTVGRDGVSRAKEALAGVQARHAPAAWPEAIRLVKAQTAEEDVNRVVVVVTDFQRTDWERTSDRGEGDRLAEELSDLLSEGAALRVVDVGGDVRRNLAVREIARPTTSQDAAREAFVRRPFRVDVKVANFGPTPVRGASVAVWVDDDRTNGRNVEAPLLPVDDPTTAPMEGEAVLPVVLPPDAFRTPGAHVVHAMIVPPNQDVESDALALDSWRRHVLIVRERIHVLAWAQSDPRARTDATTYLSGVYAGHAEVEDPDGARRRETSVYDLKTAVSPADFVETLRGARGAKPDLVVLAAVAPRDAAAAELVQYVRDGGALLAFAGPMLEDPAAWNEPFHDVAEDRILPFAVQRPQTDEGGFPIDFDHDTGHELAAPFRDPAVRDLLRQIPIHVRGRMSFVQPPEGSPSDGGAPAGTRPAPGREVLRFADGQLAVVAGRLGAGRTVWVGTSVDDSWLDDEAPTFFLPVFLDEAAVWLTRPDDQGRNLDVGERITARLPRDAVPERMASAAGGTAPMRRSGGETESDRAVVLVDDVGTAGVWQLAWRREGAAQPTTDPFAVNPRFEEGALAAARPDHVRRRLPAEADVAFWTAWAETPDATSEAAQGDLSRLLLWLLLGVLAVESFAAWAFGRRRSMASEEGS